MKKPALTVFEVVVAVFVLGVLAFFAWPRRPGKPDMAKATSDASDLHALGQVFFKYLTDHEEKMPGAGAGEVWPEEFHKLVPDYRIFKSPFDKRKDVQGNNAPVSYGVNGRAFGKNTADFVSPAKLIIMANAALPGPRGPVFPGVASENVAVHPQTTVGVYRHGGMINVLFADYHVQPMTMKVYSDSNSEEGKKHWDPLFDENAP